MIALIDKCVGRRIKECRERLGLTQEQVAEQLDVSINYISTIERGTTFPRYERMIRLLNILQTSADAIFCDVLTHSSAYRASILSEQIGELPAKEQKRILDVVELLIQQAKED